MNVVGESGELGRMFTFERIELWSEVTMHDEMMEGFRVELKCVMIRSRVWPGL